MKRLLIFLTTLGIGASLQLGCDGLECTLIGCGSTIDFVATDINGAALTTIRGTAKIRGTSFAIVCPENGEPFCSPTGFRIDYNDTNYSTVELDINDGAGHAFKGPILPTYSNYEPNGAECGPTCHQGAAAVTLQ